MKVSAKKPESIQRIILSVFLVYALVFQGLAWSVASAKGMSETTRSASEIICTADGFLLHSDEGESGPDHSSHLGHQHCALCQAGHSSENMDAVLASEPVQYRADAAFFTIINFFKTHNRLLQSIYPRPLKSRGPPLQA